MSPQPGSPDVISRALGPEFFLANVCSSALYILGVVEAVVSDFGVRVGEITVGGATPATPVLSLNSGGSAVPQVFPTGYRWSLLYGTTLLFLCFGVCLVRSRLKCL